MSESNASPREYRQRCQQAVATIREAVDLADQFHPDVAIMDVSVPVMTGDEATRQIKSYLPDVRVIALSMYDEADKKQSMFEAGAESYILKTISAEELIAAIRSTRFDARQRPT